MYLTAATFPCGAQTPSLITAHKFLGWRQEESIGRMCENGWLSGDSGCGLGNQGRSPL